jgi:hypothetical protein
VRLCGDANHYHVVLHVDHERANAWHEDEVLERWQTLFQLPVFVERYRQDKEGAGTECRAREEIAKYRERLMSISWFMRCINEPIARQVNAEDQCTGRFYKRRPWRLPLRGQLKLFQFAPGKLVGGPFQKPGAAG